MKKKNIWCALLMGMRFLNASGLTAEHGAVAREAGPALQVPAGLTEASLPQVLHDLRQSLQKEGSLAALPRLLEELSPPNSAIPGMGVGGPVEDFSAMVKALRADLNREGTGSDKLPQVVQSTLLRPVDKSSGLLSDGEGGGL